MSLIWSTERATKIDGVAKSTPFIDRETFSELLLKDNCSPDLPR
jgi:hypothetical protein